MNRPSRTTRIHSAADCGIAHGRSPRRALDERLWPILAALAAWAAVLAAVVVSAGGFDDPRPWCNGWMRLVTLGATLGLLVAAVFTIQPHRARRLKLAAAVSLFVHTLAVVTLYGAYLELTQSPQPELQTAVRPTPLQSFESPSFAAWREARRPPPAESELSVASVRPQSQPLSVPRHETSFDPLVAGIEPISQLENEPRPSTSLRGRPIVAGSLPKAVVAVPEIVGSSPPLEAASTPLAPFDMPWERIVPPEPPLEIVSGVTEELASVRLASRPALPARQPELALLSTQVIDYGRRPSNPASRRRPAPAYAHRTRRQFADDDRNAGGMANEKEAAIELGLEFLARVQMGDGRWRFHDLAGTIDVDAEPTSVRADAAATGLALLAYLGAGYDHFGGRYHRVVDDGLDCLLRIQADTGELFPESGLPTGQVARFYSHGIATLALAEAYGMTGDSTLYEPAQRALDYLATTQHRSMGGWRYVPGTNTDLSVTAWQVMALRSGQLARLTVRPETFDRALACVEQCRDAEGGRGLYCYNPWASAADPKTRHGCQPSTVMTAAGLVARFHLDADKLDSFARLGAEHLLANLPEVDDSRTFTPNGTLGNPGRDTYYWYYGTLAMHTFGGDDWESWSARLQPLLVQSQIQSGRSAGSWDPLQPVPDKWSGFGGRLYVTTMNLLSLEIANRHLRLDDHATPRIAESPK